ncbi:MAG: feruloyl-CoA synthase [Vicinamibacteria bacterium]
MSPAFEGRLRTPRMLPPDAIVSRDDGGRLRVRSPHALGPYPATLTHCLATWAERAPDRTFIAARRLDGFWERVTYRVAFERTRSVAQALLDRGLSADRPIVILSGNGLEHAVLGLAAMHAGVPYAPIAPSYSLVSKDHRTLAAVCAAMRPGLIFAAEGERFDRALASLALPDDVEVVTSSPAPGVRRQTSFAELLATTATAAVEDAHARVGPDSIAKVLFTSGSTGAPKGVINTQRMLTANQEQLRTVLAFLADEPPVLCDWLPWNHTFGGNHNFGLTLYNGGTLYIDAGAPTPAGFATTAANLREIATTAYFNVPRGYDLLLQALRGDADLRQRFFVRLQILFYAAAGLRQEVSDGIDRLAVEACGERVPWVTGLGATETAPFALCTGTMAAPVSGRVGVAAPGVELKLEPVGAVLEARVRGPNVTPGYWGDPALTRAAFDDEGFYAMGDALGCVDPADPARGFMFQGRIAEDFKLSTGTWVRVGPLRAALLAALGELAQDVVIAAPERDDVRVLVFPNLAACRRLAGLPAEAPVGDVLDGDVVCAGFAAALSAFSAAQAGSSTRVTRALLLAEPPSIDGGEITDKGSINQKAVLRRRAAFVDALYGAGPPIRFIEVEKRTIDA